MCRLVQPFKLMFALTTFIPMLFTDVFRFIALVLVPLDYNTSGITLQTKMRLVCIENLAPVRGTVMIMISLCTIAHFAARISRTHILDFLHTVIFYTSCRSRYIWIVEFMYLQWTPLKSGMTSVVTSFSHRCQILSLESVVACFRPWPSNLHTSPVLLNGFQILDKLLATFRSLQKYNSLCPPTVLSIKPISYYLQNSFSTTCPTFHMQYIL